MSTKNFAINLELCTCTEWLRENAGLCLDSIESGSEDAAADELHARICGGLEAAGYNVENAKGQRRTFHGWNGANTFTHLLGPVGTFDKLTNQQTDEILGIIGRARDAVHKEFAQGE